MYGTNEIFLVERLSHKFGREKLGKFNFLKREFWVNSLSSKKGNLYRIMITIGFIP